MAGFDATGERAIRILLAEDDENDAFLFQRCLKRCGLPVSLQRVLDGEQAIECLSQCGEGTEPALVILDVHMPKVDGFEALDWIRSRPHLQHIPILLFSSSDMPRDLARAQQLGASEYYVKPTNLQDYTAIVPRILQTWLGNQGSPPAA